MYKYMIDNIKAAVQQSGLDKTDYADETLKGLYAVYNTGKMSDKEFLIYMDEVIANELLDRDTYYK